MSSEDQETRVPRDPLEETATQRRDEEVTRTVGSGELMGARGLLHIEHKGEIYTLRITRNERLILTK